MTEKLKITGTMIPILMMGEHYNRTPGLLFDEAIGLIERQPVDTGDTRRGLEMEIPVINEVCKQSQYSVESLQAEPVMEHELFTATGHVDAIVCDTQGNRIVLEVKCPRSYKAKRIEEDGCPPEYVLQASWYALLVDAHHAEVIVWDCDAWDYVSFQVPRSSHLEALMLTRATAFAEAVASGVRPGEVVSLAKEVPVIGKTVIDAEGEVEGLLRALADKDVDLRIAQACIAEMKQQLSTLWPAEIGKIRSQWGTASMSAGRTVTQFDHKSMLKDHPEIEADKYTKKTTGQPFITFRTKEEKI